MNIHNGVKIKVGQRDELPGKAPPSAKEHGACSDPISAAVTMTMTMTITNTMTTITITITFNTIIIHIIVMTNHLIL